MPCQVGSGAVCAGGRTPSSLAELPGSLCITVQGSGFRDPGYLIRAACHGVQWSIAGTGPHHGNSPVDVRPYAPYRALCSENCQGQLSVGQGLHLG